MQKLIRFCAWLFLLLVFLASVIFSFFNSTAVPLSFGFFMLSPQPLSLWVISAFALGGVIGLSLGIGLFRSLRARLEVKRLRTRLDAAEQEIAALKLSITDSARVVDTGEILERLPSSSVIK